MRVTITPSEDQISQKYKHYSVTIEHPCDDVNCQIAIELVVNALIAWGFPHDTIMDAMEEYKP
jgi:hypothetical protein